MAEQHGPATRECELIFADGTACPCSLFESTSIKSCINMHITSATVIAVCLGSMFGKHAHIQCCRV